MIGYIDIEDALQAMLNSAGFNAGARPLPAGFGTPHVLVTLLNAADTNRAQALYNVALDCRADDYEGAVALARAVSDWARGLEGRWIGEAYCHQLDSLRMTQAQPDASHEDVIMSTVSVGLLVRI